MKLTDIILESKRITLSYTDPGDRLYSISINGEKQRGEDQNKAIQMIKKITGLEVPQRAMYHSEEVNAIVDALRSKGYESQAYPMDVT